MTHEEFIATAKPVSDLIWIHLKDDAVTDRAAYTEYGDGFVLYEHDGKYWPIAWWYPAVDHETLEQAQRSLYEWSLEWAD